jgi:hypothetical protein
MEMKEQYTAMAPLNAGWQFWLNPEDKLVYAGASEPSYGFKDDYFFPVFDPKIRLANISSIRKASMEGLDISSLNLKSPYIDEEFHQMYLDFRDAYLAGGRQKAAALTSPANSVVNILNVFPKLFGLKERKYAARNLAQEIGIPNLVIDIDTVKKHSGMVEIGELQLPYPKEIRYNRTHYEAKKYGLIFEISEEAMLKNIHNPLQDSITIASTKVEQRVSFDIVSVLESGLTSVTALGDWGAFTANTDHSTVNPKKDITRIITSSIEATGVGGTFNRLGMHSVSYTDYESNSFIRGLFPPAPNPAWEPSIKPIKGLDGVGLVQDYFIPQGVAYVLDVGDETCCALLQGPTRVASKREEISGSEIYGIFDFHLAAIINPNTGRRITGVSTPVAPA